MKLDFIPLDRLAVSRANMRHSRRAPDISDILPSVRARGVLMPILVRPAASSPTEAQSYEIVAGCRRFAAAQAVHAEARVLDSRAQPDPVPCAIIEAGDDAAAIEASLIENMARLDPDETRQWESFTRLVRAGRSIDDLSATFGLPSLAVRRILALGNLLPRIRSLYGAGEIDVATVRHLTLASKGQQKSWLALRDDPDSYCPTGHQLKAWLLGGPSIPTRHALFDLAAYGGRIVADLFGEDGYFADKDAFWAAQNAAIAARRIHYLEAGWSDVVILAPGQWFHSYEYERTSKRRGGRVYVAVRQNGEVTVHEGYVTAREAAAARRRARGDAESVDGNARPVRPELTAALTTYVDLHRHAAVRLDLLARPDLAFRLMVAHAIAGTHLWHVTPEPRRAQNASIAQSVASAAAQSAFAQRRAAVVACLGSDPDCASVTGGSVAGGLIPLFARLCELPDPVILDIAALVMGETLAAGTPLIETLGLELGTDMARYWQADEALFESLRDRDVLLGIVAEVAGETVANANAAAKAKGLKAIIRAQLDGADGRVKVENWVPRWMRFAPSAYPGLFGAYNAGPERYAAYLGGRRNLPPETIRYLAQLTTGPASDAVSGPGSSPAITFARRAGGLFAVRVDRQEAAATDAYAASAGEGARLGVLP